MNYQNTALRDVSKEFENNSREALLEQIAKYRKIINGLTHNINNTITELKREDRDGSVVLDCLEQAIERAKCTDASEYNNIFKEREDKNKSIITVPKEEGIAYAIGRFFFTDVFKDDIVVITKTDESGFYGVSIKNGKFNGNTENKGMQECELSEVREFIKSKC